MLVHKCDKCCKAVRNDEKDQAMEAGIGHATYDLCRTCGTSIVRLLKKYKLVK